MLQQLLAARFFKVELIPLHAYQQQQQQVQGPKHCGVAGYQQHEHQQMPDDDSEGMLPSKNDNQGGSADFGVLKQV